MIIRNRAKWEAHTKILRQIWSIERKNIAISGKPYKPHSTAKLWELLKEAP